MSLTAEGIPMVFTFRSLSTRRLGVAFDMVVNRGSKQTLLSEQQIIPELDILYGTRLQVHVLVCKEMKAALKITMLAKSVELERYD